MLSSSAQAEDIARSGLPVRWWVGQCVAEGPRLRLVTPKETEAELRRRLIHWIRRAMWCRNRMSESALAKSMGVPVSSLHRWLAPGTAPFPMVWLGRLCEALQVDPDVFVVLRAIPADPLEPFLLTTDTLAEVVHDAGRLAQLDSAGEGEPSLPVAGSPEPSPRKRPKPTRPRCLPGGRGP